MAWIRLARAADGCITASGALSWSAGYQVTSAQGRGGVYAGWRFEAGTFTLFTDRYGFHPLFYWRTDDACVVASTIDELIEAGAPPDLDEDALAVFVRVGFHVGDDTPFARIRAVPPSAELIWTPAGPRIEGCPPPPPPRLDLSRDDAIDAFLVAFDRAVARRVAHGRFEVPLSGGRDSRHILLALRRRGATPAACVTVQAFPPRGDGDVRVAAELCARLAVPHVVIPQRRPRLDVEREKNRRTSYCSDEHAQFVALADYLRSATIESYDGIAGDVLTQSAHLTPALHALFEAGDLHAVAEAVLDGGGRAVSEVSLARLLRREVAARLSRERAIARVEREAQLHACRANPAGSFYFWNRTRREIALAPYALMRPVTMFAPFLDREVFDLLAALPASLLMDRQFHTDAIGRAYPDVAGVPYAEPTPARTRPRGQRRLAADLGVTAWQARQLVSPRGLAPGLLATMLSGNPARLWHLPLLTYLQQLAEVGQCTVTPP